MSWLLFLVAAEPRDRLAQARIKRFPKIEVVGPALHHDAALLKEFRTVVRRAQGIGHPVR